MRTVLCLGGTGQFGLPIARHLADDHIVDRVIVAGRDLAKAQAAAATLGPKGGRAACTRGRWCRPDGRLPRPPR